MFSLNKKYLRKKIKQLELSILEVTKTWIPEETLLKNEIKYNNH